MLCGSVMGVMETVSADRELVLAYSSEGSEVAFRALVARHVNLVFAAAFRQVGDSGLAEEITQNVFVALARKAPRLVGHETLAGWLHRTAILESKACIRAELRRRRREETAASLATLHPAEASSPYADLTPLLDEALLNLRESDRLAVILRFLEQRSLREVGTMLGIEEDAARKRVARALDRMTQFFRSRGFAVPSAGGMAVLGDAAAQAAPAGLAAVAAGKGLAAGGAATGLPWMLLNWMSWSPTQIACVGALMLAAPVVWQERAVGDIRSLDTRLAIEESAALARLAELEAETARLSQSLDRGRAEVAEIASRTDSLESRLAALPAGGPYRWNDSSPVARIPKEMIQQISLSGVRDRRGELHPMIRAALQLTDVEAASLQSALNRFLGAYHDAVAAVAQPVEPTSDDRDGVKPEDVRVFEVRGIQSKVAELRAAFFAELETILDAERNRLFVRSLENWMPTNDEDRGVNSGMAVFAMDHRVRFRPIAEEGLPEPTLFWGVAVPGKFSFNITIAVRDIPPPFRPHLQDWLEQASRSTEPPPVGVSLGE
jgi:RNA polymerase sigma factor (sigma-70 family)